jgi:probable F420-dependent oxidoreductase
MRYGLATMVTDTSIPASELAVAAEERGFESLWVAEHSHIPACRRSPWPGGPELPKMYYEAMDPFVVLAAAAAVTTTLRLGTGICLVVQRDPIQTAKEVATLDRLSKGRFLFGIGAGWNAEEMAHHGTRDFARRFKLMRERVEAMKVLWTETKAEYHGEFVDFEPSYAWPKPAQEPYPPIHVGGGFPGAARRAIRYGSGWMPILGRDDQDPAKLAPSFRAMAEEAGRDPASLEISVYGVPPDADTLQRLEHAGIDRVVFGVPAKGADAVLPLLDTCAGLVQAVG